MRKEIRINIRRIMALVLTAAVIISNDYVVKADTDIIATEDVNESILAEEEIIQDSNVVEAVSDSISDGSEANNDTIVDEVDLSTEAVVDGTDSVSDIVVEETEVLPEVATDEGEIESELVIEEAIPENAMEENGEVLVVEEAFDEEAVEESVCEDGATLSAEDKKARNDDTIGETAPGEDWKTPVKLGLKLRQYLAAKYPAMDTIHDNVVTTAEMQANTTYTTIEIKGSDFPAISKNMVQFNQLSNIANVDTVIFDGVDEIRNFYLPKTTKNLIIRNTTLNMYSDGILGEYTYDDYSLKFGDLEYLETFVLDNVTIGNRFETVDKDDEETNSGGRKDKSSYYAVNYKFDLSNCKDLKEFRVNAGFLSAASALSFNMGGTYSFDKMTREKFEVNKLTDKGKIVISSTKSDSFFSENYATVSEVTFDDNYFRAFLIQKIGADINGDGFLTQDELDKITNLDINISTVGSRYIEVIHNFNDLKHLRNLEKLTIELGQSGNRYIESIAFPDTGNLKELSITNTTTKYASLEVPAVEKFTYSDNTGVEGDGGKENPPIIVNDTTGGLKAVTMKNAYVSSLVLKNTSANAGKISLDLYKCNALQKVEFTGKGYILKGDASFEECGNLNHIGQEKTSGVWQVDGEFDGNQATFDLTNCVKLCSGISEQIINYNFSSGQRLNVVAYGLTEVKSDQDLTVNRIGSIPGDIYIYCESGSYMYTKYTGEGTTGYYAKGTAAEPNVAVFPCGNAIRKSKGEDGWVDRWDIVLRKGSTDSNSDTINNFTNSLSFYSADDNCARRVNYSGALSFKIESSSGSGNDIVSINNTNHTLRAENEGRATIKVYLGNDTSIESKCIGYVNVYVRSIVTSISLTDNTPELGEGTRENPIYVAKEDGVVSFSATQKYAGDNLLDKPDEVYWIIAKYENGEYNEMINSLTSYDGISVVPGSDKWDGRTNTRAFSFKGDTRKYKLIAQSMVNKTDNSANGSLIRQERYIEVVGPAVIDISNEEIVHGSTGQESSTISVKDVKRPDISIEDATRFGKYFIVEKDESASSDDCFVWQLKFKDDRSAAENLAIKNFIANNNTITLKINADGASYEKSIGLSSVWEASKYNIAYKLNGGTNNGDNPIQFTALSSDITLKDPVKTGYTFLGWTGSNGSTPQKTVIIVTGTTGDKEYTANYEAIKYKVNYVLGITGVDNSANPTTHTYDEAVDLKEISKSGYIFDGWYLEDTFTNKVTSIAAKQDKDVTVYAKWTAVIPTPTPTPTLTPTVTPTAAPTLTPTVAPTPSPSGAGEIEADSEVNTKVNMDVFVKVDNIKDAVELTPEEQKKLASGVDLKLDLVVKDNPNVPQETKEAIGEAIKTNSVTKGKDVTVEEYLDISLFKYFEDEDKSSEKAVHKTKTDINISIQIKDAKENREYRILRLHDGKTDILGEYDSKNKIIRFSTRFFSDYAIISFEKEDKPGSLPRITNFVWPTPIIKPIESLPECKEVKQDTIYVDTDTCKSEKPIGTVCVSTDGVGNNFMDMKIHFLDNRTLSNQLFLANLNLKTLKAKKLNVIESFGVYPRRDLSITETGSKQKLVYKLPEKLPVNTVIYAQCYSSKDGAYVISGLVTSNGYAVFNDYLLRNEVNVTIFTVE